MGEVPVEVSRTHLHAALLSPSTTPSAPSAPRQQPSLRGGESTTDRDTAASNRSTCQELFDMDLFV